MFFPFSYDGYDDGLPVELDDWDYECLESENNASEDFEFEISVEDYELELKWLTELISYLYGEEVRLI